jgi:hypothetical protein
MDLDKTIQELTNRLDEVHPYSASSSVNHLNRNDGITYWKGKKIISTKAWNELYEKSSTYTNAYTTTLISKRQLQYFPDAYNGSISTAGVVDEKLKEEIQNWNTDYYELHEFKKNPILGRKKCSKCLLSGSNDDPIFVGIEKVFARIVSNQCNNNDTVNDYSHSPNITYHCNVMNIFTCPFESKEESKLPYTKEDLFALHQISFVIEQAITTFFEITKDNEIIYEVDFVNDRVQEIHTKYNGEPESWGWNDNIKEQLSKVKLISNIKIMDENDIYNILTNREKLECLLQEYEKNHLDKVEQQKVCCDENTPCVPKDYKDDDSNNEKVVTSSLTTITSTEPFVDSTKRKKHEQLQQQVQDRQQSEYLHKGENCHSKKTEGEELDNENLKLNLKAKIKDVLENSDREQLILLREQTKYH